MNPIGANTWIWVSPLDDSTLAELAPRIRGWGFDVIECPIEHPGDWDPARASEVVAAQGLGVTLAAVMPPGRDLSVTDADVVASTQSYLRHCVDVAVQVASPVVAGPMYSPVGRTWRLDDAERKEVIARVSDGLRPVADYAAQAGVGLAIEPLNRFETSLINTVEQALELVGAVDSPACGIALDTFHMNIEERDLPAAIRLAGSHLLHVQVCANDRGAPGADHLDWPGIAAALADVGYAGALCIESFTAENQTIATAASIWRPLARSQDAIATDGLAFLRRVLAG